MGSSKKQTTGYWYHPTFMLGLHQGPCDAFLRFRAGEVDAWSGELTASGTIEIIRNDLWGGIKSEGGIVGRVEVWLGEVGQGTSAYYDGIFGADLSEHAGATRLIFRGTDGAFDVAWGLIAVPWGRFGANNPYPKPVATLSRRILKGWDGDACWYPEKAEIVYGGSGVTTDGYFLVQAGALVSNSSSAPDGYGTVAADFVGTAAEIGAYCINVRNTATASTFEPGGAAMTGATPSGGFIVGWATSHGPNVGIAGVTVSAICPPGYSATYIEHDPVSGLGLDSPTVSCVWAQTDKAMNPAHIIYDSLVAQAMQGEPVGLVNDASFRAAADQLFAEEFGLCTDYNADEETVEQFRQRICNVIGAQCSRSPVDGLWYLDLIRGGGDPELLPVLSDADILEFGYDPSILDDAVNQVSVEWFDPQTKQKRTTAAMHALGAVQAMGGLVPEVATYLEIPTESLAMRVQARDLQAKATPTKRLSLVTTRVPYSWRRGTYFRLQAPKHGIADMVCLLLEINRGSLRSGAIRLVAVQDVYSLPATTYLVGQPPVSSAPQPPTPVAHQVVFEAPYTELAGTLPAAELAALDVDSGFLQVAAVRPTVGLNYLLYTRLTGAPGFDEASSLFDWCPSALVTEASSFNDTPFTLTGGTDLAQVAVGSLALWGSEWVRVDALDTTTGAVSFGRAVADSAAVKHAAGERVYFVDTWSGTDQVEYVTAETVEAKLVTRTGTEALDPASTATATVTFNQRAARPYPPARVRINTEADPVALSGVLTATWAHRDRVQQADQLVDTEATDVGPEAGTTYTVRWYLDGVLETTDAGIVGTSQAHTPAAGGLVRVELESVRDGLTSWQMQVRELYYTPAPADFLAQESGDLITLENGDPILLE